MKLNARERSVSITLFSSAAVQQIADLGQWKIAGEEGTIAHRCAEAAKSFVQVGVDLDATSQQAAVALTIFANQAGLFLMSGQGVEFAKKAFGRSADMLGYVELEDRVEAKAEPVEGSEGDAPKADGQSETLKPEGGSDLPQVVDVPTEKLELPPVVVEQLLAQSTPEVDLSTAVKLRAYDKAKDLKSLKHVGDAVAKKIREAIDKAIGPEVAPA